MQISCTFQWYRALNGKEEVIAGADKASYVVSKQDVGHLLKVVRPSLFALIISCIFSCKVALLRNVGVLGDELNHFVWSGTMNLIISSGQDRMSASGSEFILTSHDMCP